MSPVDPAHAGPTPGAPEAPEARTAEASRHPEDPDLAHEPAPEALDPATQRALENRYGSGRSRSFDRRFAYGIAGALVAAGLAFLVFSGWQTASQVSWQDIGYTNRSELVLDVKFEVTAPVNVAVACAVEGLNPAKATVGWKIVEIPASEYLTHTVTTKLVVTNPAVAATARECWTIS